MDCGLTPDEKDYDSRTPLHLAAAGGKLLAVSFLLGQGADACCKDRWGQSPLDDAVRGGTLYHQYCAKMIYMNGGQLAGCEEDRQSAQESLETITMTQVRSLVKQLLSKGCDRRDPREQSDDDILLSFDSLLALLLAFPCPLARSLACLPDRSLARLLD